MDNFGDDEDTMTVLGLRIEIVSTRTNAKYQPLDLGLISNGKIRYRCTLLHITVVIMLNSDFLTAPSRPPTN